MDFLYYAILRLVSLCPFFSYVLLLYVYYQCFIHLAISLYVIFLPYIKIPVLYIFAAIQVNAMKLTINIINDTMICHIGIPKGILVIMHIGDVNGIIDNVIARAPSGLFTTCNEVMNPSSKGVVIGNVNCCESVLLSVSEPAAAYNVA